MEAGLHQTLLVFNQSRRLFATVFIAGSLSLLVSIPVNANPTCAKVLEGHSLAETLKVDSYLDRMEELLLGKTPGHELAVLYSQATPSMIADIKRVSGGSYIPEALEKLFPDPWASRFFHDSIVDAEKMYSSVYSHYSDTFQGELIKMVKTVDGGLEPSRLSYGEIRSRERLLGTWRVFQASGARLRPVLLPYMRMNQLRKLAGLKIDKILMELMKRGIGVHEIGKFTVFKSDSETSLRTSNLVEMNWLLNSKDEDVYVAHVTTPAHARLYRKYGFEVAEEFSVPGTDIKEAILWVRGWKFKEALRERLKIEAVPFVDNPVEIRPL